MCSCAFSSDHLDTQFVNRIGQNQNFIRGCGHIFVVYIKSPVGAVFGQVAGDVAYIMVAWECSLVDAIFSFFYLFQDPEYADFVSGFCADLALGSLFAILGAIGVLKKASKENKDAALTTKILE